MKKIIFSFIFILANILVFTSCTKNDFESYDYAKAQKTEFKANFEKTFGTIDGNQDWGFGNVVVYDYTQPSSARALTRGHNVNGNLWYQQWERPVNVTDTEKEKVVAEFSKVRENAKHTENLPWDNYWVQQVYQGTQPSVDGTGKNVYPKDVMNQLIAWNFNDGKYEHVNNFNNANNTTEYTDDITKEKFIGTTLMINMGTGNVDDQFGYHNTSSSDYYYDYIILEIDGAYYVGFDIVGYHPVGQDANANMDVNRDWIFNDWIVKISPALFNMDGANRIIAEDLGATESDFDYNDVVFDIKLANTWDGELNKNVLVGYFELQAAGGTLPLTIAGKEVHELFGVATNQMVNTGAGPTKNPVQFKVILGDADWSTSPSTLIKNIPVIVKGKNGIIELATETGQAPEKICVPTTFRWCKEYKQHAIYLGYPDFPKWVQDKNYEWKTNYIEEHLY